MFDWENAITLDTMQGNRAILLEKMVHVSRKVTKKCQEPRK